MEPCDIENVGALAGRIWRAHYPGIISAQQIDYMLERMYAPQAIKAQLAAGHRFFILYADGVPAGFASLETVGPQRFFLHKFYIDQQRARRGLGSGLMQWLLHEHAPREMALHVNRRNIGAVNFYFRHGFTIDGVMETPIGHGYIMDDFRMKRLA